MQLEKTLQVGIADGNGVSKKFNAPFKNLLFEQN